MNGPYEANFVPLAGAQARSERFEQDILSAVPQHVFAERTYVLIALYDRQKMISRKLADFAGEMHPAIGQQDFGLADAARIENELARRRIAGVVLVMQAEIELAEGDPAALAAPAHVDDSLFVRQHRAE